MNVLGIGSHFDDLELGCGGTLAKHAQNGDTVTLLVVTDSAYSAPDGTVIRDAQTAMEEGQAAAEILGADMLCLGYPTFQVPFDEFLTRDIHRIMKERNIDTVYSHWVHDLHRDHQYTGRSALMAGRHVPRFLMYRSNYYDTTATFVDNFYSDISQQMLAKIKAIRAHHSELSRVEYRWIEFFEHQNRNDGQKIGVRYAEAFELVRYLL